MDLVFSFAHKITVLVNGAVLTDGTPEAIANDPRVRAVYLGDAGKAQRSDALHD
jgi:branched-chain amino acid transport system ATP-binding protein